MARNEPVSTGDAGGFETTEPLPGTIQPEPDLVETALAHALTEATKAGRWDVVGELARQLDARRVARLGNVVRLDASRAKRGGDR